MVETSTRVRTAMGNVTRALGNLPLKVEVDGKSFSELSPSLSIVKMEPEA